MHGSKGASEPLVAGIAVGPDGVREDRVPQRVAVMHEDTVREVFWLAENTQVVNVSRGPGVLQRTYANRIAGPGICCE
jgi:hypothetical protein